MKIEIEHHKHFCRCSNVIVLTCRRGELFHSQCFPEGVGMTYDILEEFRKSANDALNKVKESKGEEGLEMKNGRKTGRIIN